MANGQTHILILAMTLLFGLLFSVVIFMLGYLIVKKKDKIRLNRWKQEADQLIWSSIFHEEPSPFPIPAVIDKWLHKPSFRECLIDELIFAKKDLAGSAADNLKKLYAQLGLEADSEKKMNSLKWHIKARGIQELAAMDRRDKVGRIYRQTNNRNEFVRMEAQLAIVQLYGHEGLRFLDIVSQPITEWQQIKLLSQLHAGTDNDLEGIGRWLRSPNESVIAFALKLVSTHRRLDLHDEVAACLQNPSPRIRVLAVGCLEQIAGETTASHIIAAYPQNEKHYHAAALQVLASIGTPEEIPFLTSQLGNEDHSLKLAAARALTKLGEAGARQLDEYPAAGEYPWSDIFLQAKTGMPA